jgi:LuxR family transcriptional regulator of spore coat protein
MTLYPQPLLGNLEARRGDGLGSHVEEETFGLRILTSREREVFELLVQNLTTREIAGKMFISEKTVRNHISNVMQKLNVKGRAQAVVELIRLGELKI